MQKVRYAMIGTGNRGRHLMKAALGSEQVEITAIADSNPASLQEGLSIARGIRGFASYHDMLEWGQFDAVVIASPNDLHEQIVIDALNSNVHILCEKPLSNSLESIDRILEKVKNYQKVFQIGMELRYHPLYQQCKDAIARGDIGPVRMMWCKEFRGPFRKGIDEWRHDRARVGGSLLEKNCHHFDWFNWMVDSKPVKVSAFGGNNVIYQAEGILDNAWVNIEYENHARASLGLALFQQDSNLELGVLGDDGSAVCTSPDEKLLIKSRNGNQNYSYGHLDDSPFDHGGEIEQHLAFVERIRTGQPSKVTLESIRNAHLICVAAEESIRTGRTIDLI